MKQANPVLIETERGNWVENHHRGAFCIADGYGDILAAAGDIERAIFPRSAIKAMQALAMFQSGAVEKFKLGDEAIALACASHHSEPEHVVAVQRFLDFIGCTIDDLECGDQPPSDAKARRALVASGAKPSAIHNNCSGKHSGMLAVAKALGVETKDYSNRDHEVQKLVRQSVEAVIGESLTTGRCGTDGCSIPTWAAPLRSFAQGFARMATGEGLTPELGAASKRIFDAATSHPFLVRGTNTLDSDLMAAFEGRLMIKIGADGVYCGALRDRGIGFALKIDDGNMKAAEVAVASLLLTAGSPSALEKSALEKYATNTLSNWRKIEVGKMSATDAVRVTI